MLENNTERSSKMSALEVMINKEASIPEEGRSYHHLTKLTLVISLIGLSSFYFGFSLTYLSTIPSSTLEMSYGSSLGNPTVNAILIGCVPLGAILGSLLANPMMRVFSRRYIGS